jgi:hypothetical protein
MRRKARDSMQRLRALVALMVTLVALAGAMAPVRAQDAEENVNRALDGALGGTWEAFAAYHGDPGEGDVWTGVPTSFGPADIAVSELDGIVVDIILSFPEYDLASEEPVTGRDVFAATAAFTPLDARCRLKPVATGFAAETYLCTSTEIEKTLPETTFADLGVIGEPGAYAMLADPVDDDVFEIIITLGHDLDVGAGEDVAAPSGDGATLTGEAQGSLDGVFGGSRASWDEAFGAPIEEGIDEFGYPYADYESEFALLSVSFNPETGNAEYILVEVVSIDREISAVVADALAVVASYDTCTAIVLDVAEAMYECQSADLAAGLTQEDYDLAGSGNALGTFMVLAGEVEAGTILIEVSL